ncbi:MAG: NAD(+) synthase [Candidatus Adiutrix sp.]|jgi:NAD+ synthetase|nr:NAD(+) synthase [Candidatus Adiutrix sp.]
MRVALIQSRVVGDCPAENLESLKAALKRQETEGVELAVFPALALSGRLGPTALARPGLEVQYQKVWGDFLEISKTYPKLTLASSALFFEAGGAAREEAFAVRDGRRLDKAAVSGRLFSDFGLELLLRTKDLALAAETRADVIISLGSHFYQGVAYQPPFPGPAQAWRMNVSAVGGEGPRIYEGATWVFDPAGRLVGWAHGFENAMIVLDTESTALKALEPRPEREPLEVLYQALKTGLRDFVRSAGLEKVLLGLSGGLDSALTAVLAVDALGADQVLAVAMPSEYNSPDSLNLARELSKNLGLAFLTIPIDGLREAFTRSFLLTPKRDEQAGHLAEENIQARIRGVILMYLANREGRLLLATGNKSEAAMGYATLYGDTCGAMAPIGDVYKSRLFELARHLNRAKERIPEGIISRPPSAELRPGQKDEDALPPYAVLDDILHRHLEGRRSGSQVAREGGHPATTVAWVLSSLKKSAFKRAQEPFSLIASGCPLGGFDWPA